MKVCIVAAVSSDAGLNAKTAECNSTGAGYPTPDKTNEKPHSCPLV
jgi:hypothetical protein